MRDTQILYWETLGNESCIQNGEVCCNTNTLFKIICW